MGKAAYIKNRKRNKIEETSMCFLDSPIARCDAVHEMVLTDETQRECAREHNCPPGRKCLLDGYFTETSGMADGEEQILLHPVPH